MKFFKLTFLIALLSCSFISCYDDPIQQALDYVPRNDVTIKIESTSGAIEGQYIMTDSTLTITFSHDFDGYYMVTVLDSSMNYYSGSMGWVDYTAGTPVTVNINGPANKTGYYFGDSGTYYVQITGRDLQSRQGSYTKSYTVAPSGSIYVSGAGTSIVNGLYLADSGSFNYYSAVYTIHYSKSGSPTIYMSTDDAMPGWHFHQGAPTGYTEYYYFENNTSNPPPTTGWSTTGGGVSPTPTLTISP